MRQAAWLFLVLGLRLCAENLELSHLPYPTLPWFALVTSPIDGVCETRLAQGRGGEGTLAVGALGSSTECPGRIVVFAPLQAPTVFTGRARIKNALLGKPAEVNLKIWYLTCRGAKGAPCGDDEKNLVPEDAELDVAHARYQYDFSFTGIVIRTSEPDDVHTHANARALDRLGEDLDCDDFTSSTPFFSPGKLNIYYASASNGFACTPIPGSPDPVRRAGFVVIPPGRTVDLLSHEIGHLLLDDGGHPGDDLTNVMSNGSLSRCNFSLDQAYRVHVKRTYTLYGGVAPQEPLTPRELCKTDDCRTAARAYPGACPQEVVRVYTDWIRCLHCASGRVPKVDVPENSSRLVPTLKMVLTGRLRIEDRVRMEEEVTEKAEMLSNRYPGFARADFSDFYWKLLFEKQELRAADALMRLDNVCDFASKINHEAVGAFESALTLELSPAVKQAAEGGLGHQKGMIPFKNTDLAKARCRAAAQQ